MRQIDRRAFLSESTKTVFALGATTLAFRSESRAAPASEKVRLAAIGVGGRCSSLIRGFLARDDCEVVTLCDVYPERDVLLRTSQLIAEKQGRAPKIVQDFRRVLDDKSVDAVIIGTPDHWHAPLTIFACQAEKDVYVEKPPTHNIWEGRKMVQAARRYQRIVQVGTQSRSAPYVQKALELVHSGELGTIGLCKVFNMKSGDAFSKGKDGQPRAGMDYNTWLGPAQERPYNDATVYRRGWHQYWDFSGGDLADDGIHQLDIARWLVGKGFPSTVQAMGGNFVHHDDREVPDTQSVAFNFDSLVMTFELTQWAPYMQKTNGRTRQGNAFPYWPQNATRIELYGSKNLMTLGRHGGGWQIFTDEGKIVKQEYGRFPDDEHKENFIACIKSRKPTNANPEEGHRSAVLVHMANIAYRIGDTLRFDAQTETFVDNAAANRLVRRDYRKGFAVPDVI